MARILRRQTQSMRGTPVDFGALQAQNATQPTLGNTRTNVRGDLLGDNGVILKTQEEIEAEWARKRALQARVDAQMSIKADKLSPDQKITPTAAPVHTKTEFPTIGDLVDQGVIPPAKRKIADHD
jgi:hypothetical protein